MGLLVEPAAAAVQPDILLGAAVSPEVEAAAAPKRTYFRPVCGCPKITMVAWKRASVPPAAPAAAADSRCSAGPQLRKP